MSNILEAMRQVERASERATPRPWSLGPPHVIWQRYCETETNARIHRPIASCDAAAGNNSENADYLAAAANHAPDIVKFARRLLEVARAVNQLRMAGYLHESVPSDYGLLKPLNALERDYPGVLGGQT